MHLNFGPISLIPTLVRNTEKLVNNKIVEFLRSNEILSHQQFGFQQSNGRTDLFIDEYNAHDNKLGGIRRSSLLWLIQGIWLCQPRLIAVKIAAIIIASGLLNWFKSYLSGRKQFVKLSATSDIFYIKCGASQGSVLWLIQRIWLC